jgi:hypothetical protein
MSIARKTIKGPGLASAPTARRDLAVAFCKITTSSCAAHAATSTDKGIAFRSGRILLGATNARQGRRSSGGRTKGLRPTS